MNKAFGALVITMGGCCVGLQAAATEPAQNFFDHPMDNPSQYSGYVESAAHIADAVTQCTNNEPAKKITTGIKDTAAFLHQSLLNSQNKNVEVHVLATRFADDLVKAWRADENLFKAILGFVFKEGVRRFAMNASQNDTTGFNPAIIRLLNAFIYYAAVDAVQRFFKSPIIPLTWDSLSQSAVEELLGQLIRKMQLQNQVSAVA